MRDGNQNIKQWSRDKDDRWDDTIDALSAGIGDAGPFS
jgi:hypothetical protein